jgi:prepilin peptidase CpaA
MMLQAIHLFLGYLPLFFIVLATIICFFICYQDVTGYRIANPLVVMIGLSALGVWLPLVSTTTVLIQLGMGLLFLTIGFALFYFKVMGAGDSKLFAALGLWCQPHDALWFLMIVAFAGLAVSCVYAGLHFLKIKALKENSDLADILHLKIPYGLALSAGGFFLFYRAGSYVFQG